jgi:hypothetical protein
LVHEGSSLKNGLKPVINGLGLWLPAGALAFCVNVWPLGLSRCSLLMFWTLYVPKPFGLSMFQNHEPRHFFSL